MIISLSVKGSKVPRLYLSVDLYVPIFFLVHGVPFQAINSCISSLVYHTGRPPLTKMASVYVFLVSGLPPLVSNLAQGSSQDQSSSPCSSSSEVTVNFTAQHVPSVAD